VTGVDSVRVADALGLRLAVASGERNVDDARRHEGDKLSAIPCLGKPLGIDASRPPPTRARTAREQKFVPFAGLFVPA
jgi:hypothetical protein